MRLRLIMFLARRYYRVAQPSRRRARPSRVAANSI
jgi:hypothetical protein